MNETPEEKHTQAQKEALTKAWDLITEHFDRAVLLINTDKLSDDQETTTCYYWRGGVLSAIGLMEVAKQRLMEAPEKNEY